MDFEIKAKTVEVTIGAKTERSDDFVDIFKRIDVSKEIPTKGNQKEVDICKRIGEQDISSPKELSELTKEYIADLKKKAKFPDTISDDCLAMEKIELQSPDKVAELREEFDDKKDDLRNEWEKLHGQEWPRYTEQDIKELNLTDRQPGNRYDAHHIQPLQLGGKNEASNITPIDRNAHSEIHSKEGSCKAMVDKVVGGI